MFSSIIVVENKADIVKRRSPYLKISCVTGEGIQNLLETLKEAKS
jgi:Ni2+-binding GTPase involved in maturation of urease and hydrogenase